MKIQIFTKMKIVLLSVLAVTLSSCAILHHVQVGTVDNRSSDVAVPFDIKLNEVGINLNEIGDIAKATNSKGGDQASDVAAILALFQIGPRTGNPVYDEHFAEKVLYQIYQACPSGKVSGLMSIREMRKYPAISGEIVKVTGYCLKPKVTPPKVSSDVRTSLEEGAI